MEEVILKKHIRIFIADRNYNSWHFVDADTSQNLTVAEYPELNSVNPLKYKLFGKDIFSIDSAGGIQMIHSYIKSCKTIAGVLVLENNKTFGRTANKKRLLYKCIPDDTRLPIFLVPYDIKIGFSKVQKNRYVVFKFDHWNDKHPQGVLVENLGDVDNLEVFYEYQLYCKSLHVSLTDFTNNTRTALSKKTNDEFVDHIFQQSNFNISDERDKYVFTIDPHNSMDYDDGFCIEEFVHTEQKCFKITVYIANVFLWLETLGLWNSFSKRVATIYLPDRRRPMLPTILSDNLCSLQQDQPRFALSMTYHVDGDGNILKEFPIEYKNVLIMVSKNYTYEEPDMIETDICYKKLLDISKLMDKSIKTSHDVVAHWMVQMNTYSGIFMANHEIGIFRSAFLINPHVRSDSLSTDISEDSLRVINMWNNTIGQYILFDKNSSIEHELMNIKFTRKDNAFHSDFDVPKKTYIHITSPIRRLVDLLNQIILIQKLKLVNKISPSAIDFLERWIMEIDYINTSMRSIRKVQTDCEVLNRCYTKPDIMENFHEGIVFDKILKNDGTFHYMVYLEQLKLLSRIATSIEVTNYSKNKFTM
jgi:exoribonuclease R